MVEVVAPPEEAPMEIIEAVSLLNGMINITSPLEEVVMEGWIPSAHRRRPWGRQTPFFHQCPPP